jgi:hypothetical protein
MVPTYSGAEHAAELFIFIHRHPGIRQGARAIHTHVLLKLESVWAELTITLSLTLFSGHRFLCINLNKQLPVLPGIHTISVVDPDP